MTWKVIPSNRKGCRQEGGGDLPLWVLFHSQQSQVKGCPLRVQVRRRKYCESETRGGVHSIEWRSDWTKRCCGLAGCTEDLLQVWGHKCKLTPSLYCKYIGWILHAVHAVSHCTTLICYDLMWCNHFFICTLDFPWHLPIIAYCLYPELLNLSVPSPKCRALPHASASLTAF